MKPRPRIRKAVKWTSAVMVVVLVLAWAVSLRWNCRYDFKHWCAGIGPGCVDYGYWPDEPFNFGADSGVVQSVVSWRYGLRPSFEENPGGQCWVVLPMWIPLLACAALWAVLWRRDRRLSRAERGGCVKCGYDRAGLACGAACPECGTIPPMPASSPPHSASSS